MSENDGKKVVKTLCIYCPPCCGIDVHVENNKPVKVEGMIESIVGPICVKAEVIPEWYETAERDRIRTPLKRAKGGIGWEEISWDEALEIIASKMGEIKERYGPQALPFMAARYHPTAIGITSPSGFLTVMVRRLFILFFPCAGLTAPLPAS